MERELAAPVMTRPTVQFDCWRTGGGWLLWGGSVLLI
jgi:hypothetical protein